MQDDEKFETLNSDESQQKWFPGDFSGVYEEVQVSQHNA